MILRVHDWLTNSEPLKRVAREVRKDELQTNAFAQFVRSLVDTMGAHRGLGLAATQVDASAPDGTVWSVFVMRTSTHHFVPVINPSIIKTEAYEWQLEACLSFRSVPWRTYQPTKVQAFTMDEDGETHDVMATGLEAICFFHEYRHLHGENLIDSIRGPDRRKFIRLLQKARPT